MDIGNVNSSNGKIELVLLREADPALKTPDPALTAPATLVAPKTNPLEQEAAKQEQEQKEQKDPKKQAEKLNDAVDKLNQTAMIFDRSLRFNVDDKTRDLMVSVVDMQTKKTIREIPPKEILDLVSKMKDYLGLIFDKQA